MAVNGVKDLLKSGVQATIETAITTALKEPPVSLQTLRLLVMLKSAAGRWFCSV